VARCQAGRQLRCLAGNRGVHLVEIDDRVPGQGETVAAGPVGDHGQWPGIAEDVG
jgi:hypothetical protein